MASPLHPEMSKRYVRSLGAGLEYLDEGGASKLIALTSARSRDARSQPSAKTAASQSWIMAAPPWPL